jgi:hypothetical protein
MRMLSNKRGIELSINFIVMLILAIAVFAGGLVFASKFFGHAEKMRDNLDAQTEKQIEKLLDSGSPVVIPISNKEIFRNKFDTFGIGVLAKFNGNYELTVCKFLVGVSIPKDAERGTYIFQATVGFKSDDPDTTPDIAEYDNPLQFIVKVP